LLSGRDAVAFMAEDPEWTRYTAARPGRLFRLILNGVAPPPPVSPAVVEWFRTERTSIPAKRDAVIGSVGRLATERRPDLLLETFVCLSKLLDRDVHLLLAGEGLERGALEAQIQRHSLGNRVHLPGLVVNSAEPLAIIDLYLTVNVGPITGIAALEAAFAGLPVIAVQLQQGYKAAPGDWIWSSTDPAEVAARAVELIINLPERQMLAGQQQAYVRAHHSVEAMARAYDRLYDDALAASRACAREGSRLVKEG
jgi:glycosyltransferase involved in cell wall biosynthesis